jgi:uncharacterized Zn-finger protein
VCTKRFVSKCSMQHHVQRMHGDGHQFKCDVCNKSFAILQYLKRHKVLHSEDRRYRCDICSMSFFRLRNLKVHVSRHTNEYPYPCDLCGKGFTYQSSLEKHKRVHTGERPYVCKVCDKSFTQKSALKTHQHVHTGERIKREATDINQEQGKSAVAITFPEIKAEEEVSCISLYPLLSGYSNMFCCQNTSVLCYTH